MNLMEFDMQLYGKSDLSKGKLGNCNTNTWEDKAFIWQMMDLLILCQTFIGLSITSIDIL